MPHSSRRPRVSPDRYRRGGERTTKGRGPAAAKHPRVPGPRWAAAPRRRRPGPGQARNMILRAAALVPAGAWLRPGRGLWWCAHRLGGSDPETRADAWNYGACGKLHRWFGGRMLDRRQRQTANGRLSRTVHTATNGLPARGSGEIAAMGARYQQGVVFPSLGGVSRAARGRHRNQAGVLEKTAPPRVLASPLDREVDGAPNSPRGILADVVARPAMSPTTYRPYYFGEDGHARRGRGNPFCDASSQLVAETARLCDCG